MDLERELRALPVDWPATPRFAPALAVGRRRRSALVAAIVVAALGTAFAVPQSRGAILRFLDLGAERIQIVGTLPAAERRALDQGLGVPVTLAEARQVVPGLLVPRLAPSPPLRRSGTVVSMVFLNAGKPVLLSEVRGDAVFLKKIAGSENHIEGVRVRGAFGLWLSGKPHIFLFPREPARLAGNTLVWQENGTTYRLEAPGLAKRDALDIARSLRDTP